MSRFHFCLFISTTIFVTGLKAAQAEVAFIGFNGGNAVYDNTGDFEKELRTYRDGFFEGKGLLLNAGGPNSTMIPMDRYGFIDRNMFGKVVLKPNTVSGAEATAKNLENAILQTAEKKPAAVTILYGDHGGRDEIGAWGEGIKYSALQSHDQKFDGNTIVRRIHTHCYSGAALAPAGFTAENSTEQNFLKAYPKNRCAFAAAMENEFATDINAVSFATGTNPFDKIRNKKPGPSLQDLKSLYRSSKDYEASPRLTSDYFIRDFLNRECALRATENQCLATDTPEAQTRRLSQFVSNSNCQQTKSIEKQIARYHQEIEQAYLQISAFNHLKKTVAIEVSKKRYPAEYANWSAEMGAREQLARCAAVPNADCSSPSNLKNLAERNSGKSFVGRYLTLTEPGKWIKDPVRGPIQTTPKDAAYNRALGAAYSNFVSSQTGQAAKLGYADFKARFDEAENSISRAQNDQRSFVAWAEEERLAMLQSSLDRPGNEAFKRRYLEIRACETSPMNQATTESATK